MKSKQKPYIQKICEHGAKCKQKGDFKGALNAYNKAISINPTYIAGYEGKVDLPGHTFTDYEIIAMERILSVDKKSPRRIPILFALARAYDKKENYEKSFTYLKMANDQKRKSLNYDPKKIKTDLVMLLELFTETEFIRSDLPEYTGNNPIFILGMPRSGTTLVEQIISSHPDVFAGGELHALSKTIRLLYPHTNMKAPRGQRLLGVTNKTREKARTFYCNELPKTNNNITHITDKMPYNFLNVGWINMLFDDPIIIHVQRNKMATLLSCYQQNFAAGSKWSYNLGELYAFFDSADLLMQYWKVLFPGKIYDINYENLIENQEEESRKLLDYCQLPWDDACLSFEKNKRKVMTASVCQVRQPIYKKSLDHWKNFSAYLTP